MILKNVSKDIIITKDLKEVKTILDKFLGLIRKSNPRFLFFKTRFGIHTFFLKEPIDVIVLDKKFKVIKIKEGLTPYRLFFWSPKYNLVLELPKSTIQKTKTEVGNLLKINLY